MIKCNQNIFIDQKCNNNVYLPAEDTKSLVRDFEILVFFVISKVKIKIFISLTLTI